MKQQFKEEEKSSYTAPVATAPVVIDTEVVMEAVRTNDPIPNFRRSAVTLKTRQRQSLQRGFMRLKGQRLSKKGALVLLSGALLFGGRWYWANQAPVIPYLPKVEVALDGPNALHFFSAAMDSMTYREVRDIGGPDIDTVAQQNEAVTKLAPALTLVREGLQYHYQGNQTKFWKAGSPYQTGFNAPVMDFIAIRTLGRGLADDARLKERTGDYTGAMSASLDAAQLGTEIGHGSDSLIQPMVGEVVIGIGVSEATRNVAKLTPEQASEALARLQKISARRTTLEEIWAGEMRQNRSLLEMLFEKPTETLPMLASRHSIMPSYFAELMRYGKQGLVDQVTDYQNAILQKFKLPYQQAQRLNIAPQETELIQLMTPNTRRIQRGYTERSVKLALLEAKLALRAGKKPVSTDAFSQTGQEPLRSQEAVGKVWSVGPNGVDEQGSGDDIMG